MADGRVFVDTNILIYAHDSQAGAKHIAAQARLRALIKTGSTPAISIQVLQELYVNLVRHRTSTDDARAIVTAYLNWGVVANSAAILLEAMTGAERWQISFWDALIIAAARQAKAKIIWSEDLNAG